MTVSKVLNLRSTMMLVLDQYPLHLVITILRKSPQETGVFLEKV